MRTRIALVVALVASATVIGLGRTTSPAGAATCGLSAFDGTRTVGGRTYELHVPAGLTGTQVPLVVSLHGFSSDGAMHAQQSGWKPFADGHNFIAAFPNGLSERGTSRNGGRTTTTSCAPSWPTSPRPGALTRTAST
jgi:poly(3-hydroxybutyrate) depolymerase